jgi:hypothetical protein
LGLPDWVLATIVISSPYALLKAVQVELPVQVALIRVMVVVMAAHPLVALTVAVAAQEVIAEPEELAATEETGVAVLVVEAVVEAVLRRARRGTVELTIHIGPVIPVAAARGY